MGKSPMSAANSETTRFCTFEHYTRAWEVGTGLRISLAPGRYRITGEEQFSGIRYYRLEGAYRVDVREISR